MTDRELWAMVFTSCVASGYYTVPDAKSAADYAVKAAPADVDECDADIESIGLPGETFFVATTTKEN